ncbi:MAG: YgjV family protein [Butyricicoccus sp.]|nr:YgjV family protein [Butyricicoccus sp.]
MYLMLAHAVGFGAMAINISSYQFKNSRQIVLCRMVSDIAYILHYLMLGGLSGCVTLIVSVLNALVYGMKDKYAWARWKGWKWFFSVLLVAACLALCQGQFEMLPGVCTLISILSVILATWSDNAVIIRGNKLLCAGPAWIIYCVAVGSYAGVLTELFGMTSAAVGFYRHQAKKKGKGPV